MNIDYRITKVQAFAQKPRSKRQIHSNQESICFEQMNDIKIRFKNLKQCTFALQIQLDK